MADASSVVVVDYGSDTCKAGFANPEQDPFVVRKKLG
jgi:actin-related protein